MSIHTSSPSSTDTDDESNDRTELSELRQRLFTRHEYVREKDPELYREIDAWLQASATLPTGDVGSSITSRLRDLKRGNKMRDHRGVDDPEDAFPADCEGCPHYGVACPMIKRLSVKKTRKRIIRTADSDDEVIGKLTDLASEWDCHVVLDALDTHQDKYQAFLQRGYELASRATAALADDEYDGESLDVEAYVDSELDADPPDEVAAEIDQTIAAVMGEDEDDGRGEYA